MFSTGTCLLTVEFAVGPICDRHCVWFLQVLPWLLKGLNVWDKSLLKRGNNWVLGEHNRAFAEWLEWQNTAQKLRHVLKAHPAGLKCQKFPFWIGFKAVKAQTLTHWTISLLADRTKHFWGLKKKISSVLFKTFRPPEFKALFKSGTLVISIPIWLMYLSTYCLWSFLLNLSKSCLA